VLLSYLRHLIAARPGTAVHDCTLYRHETKLHTDQVFLTGLRSRK
jgi:hypothetical protein